MSHNDSLILWRSDSKRASRFLRLLAAGFVGALAGCGGGGGTSPPTPTQNPVPSITSISPSSAPAGSTGLTLIVNGSSFIRESVVRWGASDRATTFVNDRLLTAAITAADLSNAGTVAVTVFNAAPGGGTSGSLNFVVATLSVLTTRLPDAHNGKVYGFTLQAGGGIPPFSWSVASGSLPEGLTLGAGGLISGTPSAVSSDTSSSFAVRVSDSASQEHTAFQPLSILVRAGSTGRNDTCAAATPVSNGLIRASVSPYGDIDVYAFEGTAGRQVTIATFAKRLTIYGDPASIDIFLDTFLEVLDSGCSRLVFNDDISPGALQDSLISAYTLPYTGTYYIRVSDLRGDGRPDFLYDLSLSGAN